MYTSTLTIKNKTGLHARPASQLVILSQRFNSQIRIIDGTNTVDPKSIISILSAGIKQGTEVRLEVEGEDEEQAGAEIVSYIENLSE